MFRSAVVAFHGVQAAICCILVMCSPLSAQIANPSSDARIQNWSTQGALVPPGATSTTLSFAVDPAAGGGDTFHVIVENPQVAITLILPNGVEITAANASTLGFQYTTIADGAVPSTVAPSPFAFPGTHSIIELPASPPAGTYLVKANSTTVSAQTTLIAIYCSSSSVKVGAWASSPFYKVSDSVVLAGLVFDATAPVAGATANASISTPISLNSQTSLGNYQLVSQTSVDAANSRYTYTASLTNTGGAAQQVSAQLTSLDASVLVVNGTLVFGNVPASGTAAGLNSFSIQRSTSQSFDPATLSWKVQSPGSSTLVPLLDSGQYDAQAGDGIYTGVFTPSVPGDYAATISVTGTSAAGAAVARTATTAFRVAPPLAAFTSFQDQATDNNGKRHSGSDCNDRDSQRSDCWHVCLFDGASSQQRHDAAGQNFGKPEHRLAAGCSQFPWPEHRRSPRR